MPRYPFLRAWSVFIMLAACDTRERICPVPQSTSEAAQMSRVVESGGEITAYLPDGRRITPAGKIVSRCRTDGPSNCIGTNPMGSALHPSGKYLAVTHVGARDASLSDIGRQAIRIIDTATMEVKQIVPESNLFTGIAWSPSGDRLYASGGVANRVWAYSADATATIQRIGAWTVQGNPYGLVPTPDGSKLLVTSSHLGELWILNTTDGALLAKLPVGDLPYDAVTDGITAWVSNLGSNDISVVDIANAKETQRIPAGKNPEQILSRSGLLYVVNSDSDSISVIDAKKKKVTRTLNLRREKELAGMSPNALAFSPDGKRLYVSIASDNAVDILDVKTGDRLGRIPTAHYPISLQVDSFGAIYILNFQGLTTRTLPEAQLNPIDADDDQRRWQFGLLQKVMAPNTADIVRYTKQVEDNRLRPRGFYPPPGPECSRVNSPIPLRLDQPSPIKHVVWIVKENKTYDVLLGDLADDKWHKKEYAAFGENVSIYTAPAKLQKPRFNITPNSHALARQYTNHVNFYAQADKSVQGHSLIVGGYVNDYTERTWDLDAGQLLIPFVEPAARTTSGDVFDWLAGQGKSVRVYGEYAGSADNLFGRAYDLVVHDYVPGVSAFPDTERIKIFLRDWKAGNTADFTYIWIPNDHTMGYEEGEPHPAWMVADNDLAVGQVVEAISRSPEWKSTAIFIFQDDPQGAPDHIDHRRSMLLTVSPYARRGVNVTANANFLSIHSTTMALLGVPPLNRLVAETPPMWDDFEMPGSPSRLDGRHYTATQDPAFKNAADWVVGNEELALQSLSKTMRFDVIDQNQEMGKLLWWAMRGPGTVPALSAFVEDDDDDANEEEDRP